MSKSGPPGSILMARATLMEFMPEEIVDQVAMEMRRAHATLDIQRCVRGHLSRAYFAHRHHRSWWELHTNMEAVMRGSVDMLERYDMVRAEWRREPSSWISSMTGELAASRLRAIMLETTLGWWSTRSTPPGFPIAQM